MVSQEYAFLLACASRGAPSASPAPDRLPQGPRSWQRVEELAAWHRLSAPLFMALRPPEVAGRVPPQTLLRLERTYYENVARHGYFQTELHKVLRAFHTAGIPAVLLKGAALVQTVYPDPALRPMGDLDLLVREQHLDAAEAILGSLGYASSSSEASQRELRARGHQYPALASPDGVVVIELHRHFVSLDSPLHFDLSALWARTSATTIGGVPALLPAPDDLLLHVCLHFFLNRRASSRGALGQLRDIADTVRHYGEALDRDRLVAQVRQARLEGPVALALFAAHALLAAPVEDMVRQLQPAAFAPAVAAHFLARRVLETRPWPIHELAAPREPYTPLTVARTFLRHLVGGSLRHLTRVLFRTGEVQHDLQIDRWYHALYGVAGRAAGGRPGQENP